MPFSDPAANRLPASVFPNIRSKRPLIHAITNAVTINDVVNMILASGAAAVCADNSKEVSEITAISSGLLLNTGMPNDDKLEAMLLAGRKANALGIPVVLDPVGAGASSYRRQFLARLLSEVHMTAIRANMSEAAALYGIAFSSKGVEDAGITLAPSLLQELAERYDTTLAVTGDTDYAVSRDELLTSHTGSPLQKQITGSGCMLSGLLAASLAGNLEGEFAENPAGNLKGKSTENSVGNPVRNPNSNPKSGISAARIVHRTLEMYGQAAEDAEQEMQAAGHIGTATFRTYLIDRISTL